MHVHQVRVSPSAAKLPKEEQLAWKLAALATDATAIENDVAEMVANRVIDNASVAIAAINRPPVCHARAQALAHPREGGASLFGIDNSWRCDAEWAAWANGTAVRELDMHDTFLAADYSHPGDNIPPLAAVAQQCRCSGAALLRGIVAAYEVQVALVKGICLHKHKKDHIAHLCPAQAAGIGALLQLPTDTVYQAIQQAVHVSFSTRQSRKGEISSWKAYAPAHAGKLAIEAVDRAMRGERSPSPIYEGEDSVLAYMLDGADAEYSVSLPKLGTPGRAILETYTKEHSAEYQAQALIDLAFRMRQQFTDLGTDRDTDWDNIERITIHTSHHTHNVIGTGAGDPQKFDPHSSRETLDHSIMYIFAVALQDGVWHHVDSYLPERASRADTVRLWKKIETVEDPMWTERYHAIDPKEKAFGGRVVIKMKTGKMKKDGLNSGDLPGGQTLEDEIAVANAHCYGERPFARADYAHKFATLTESLVQPAELRRFIELCERLPELSIGELNQLNVQLDRELIAHVERDSEGIF